MSTVVSKDILYVGVDDCDIDLFESQYVVPNGVSYNSYIIMDEKIAILDTVDPRGTEGWLANVKEVLGEKTPDYLVVHHMEPDHSGSVQQLMQLYPELQIVGNAKTFSMMLQFFGEEYADRRVVVKEGDTLELGSHCLAFITAPMVHWPEVMVSYESTEKVLFSADGFGKFGALDTEEDWACEARRYYFNIVGKYGASVQALLKKAAALDIQMICPLHGPILKENLSYYIGLYDTWSSYKPETEGVFVACASIHGNTKAAALELVEKLEAKGVKVAFNDLTRDDMAEAIEDAFRYDRMVLCCATYDGGLFPAGESFLAHLKSKAYQNRTVGLVENGTWAPMAGKQMKAAFEEMKNVTVLEPMVTIKSVMNETSSEQLDALVEALL